MKRPLIAAAAAIGIVAALGIAAPAQGTPVTHSHPKATVGLFHGIPKTPVDVYVGKTRLLDDFQPGTFAAAPALKTGHYLIRVVPAAAKSPKHPILKAYLFFKGGKSYSVIAHLTKYGKPTLTKYVNDLSPLPANKGRLTVRHVAAAPTVDAQLNGVIVAEGLRNPREAKRVLAAKTYQAGVSLTTDPSTFVLGPTALTIKPNTNTIVYAWGSASGGTLALAVREVALKQ